jgi:myo-inositol-1(or 4)-monophosphatase
VSEVEEVLALAIRLARAAGALQRERYGSEHVIETKSAAVERPGDAILAEEGGGEDRPGAPWRWVVDPLDGTTNYAHAYPRFCCSIGVEQEGRPCVGVVYDPLMDELFHATRGAGAFLNARPIRVSRETALERSLLATGFAYDRRRSECDNLDNFAAFLKAARALRRDGSAALDLCYVAAGRLDGYWELKLAPWDVAAGSLVITEAGGKCTDSRGGDGFRSGHEVVASNGAIHEAMIEVLRGP